MVIYDARRTNNIGITDSAASGILRTPWFYFSSVPELVKATIP